MSLASQLREQIVEVAQATARETARQEIEMSQQSQSAPAQTTQATLFTQEAVDKTVEKAIAAHQAEMDARIMPRMTVSHGVAALAGVGAGVALTIGYQKMTATGEEVP